MPRPDDRRTLLQRLAAPVIFRLMFVAVLLLGAVVANVRLIAYPLNPPVIGAPVAGAVHLDPISLRTSDGINVEAFLAPALDEKQLLKHGEVAVRAKWPAVVLVPDQRGDGHQLDKLIRTMHDAGYVVMLVRLRGTGTHDVPQTLGLHERHDVAAAVNHLSALRYVDQSRVSIIGMGTGATAALLARRENAAIERVIVHNLPQSFDQVLEQSVHPAWLRPACRWAFEISHQVDMTEMLASSLLKPLGRDVLVLDLHPARLSQQQQIIAFIHASDEQISVAR
jgi:alpha/beta superfamily hydrolase